MATGALLIISGFLSFNGASLGHISLLGDGMIVANSVINTIVGGSGAAVVILTLAKAGIIGESRWPFVMTINALLTGMVRFQRREHVFLACFSVKMNGCYFIYILENKLLVIFYQYILIVHSEIF